MEKTQSNKWRKLSKDIVENKRKSTNPVHKDSQSNKWRALSRRIVGNDNAQRPVGFKEIEASDITTFTQWKKTVMESSNVSSKPRASIAYPSVKSAKLSLHGPSIAAQLKAASLNERSTTSSSSSFRPHVPHSSVKSESVGISSWKQAPLVRNPSVKNDSVDSSSLKQASFESPLKERSSFSNILSTKTPPPSDNYSVPAGSEQTENIDDTIFEFYVPFAANTLEDNHKIKVAALKSYLSNFNNSKKYLNYGLFRKKRRSIYEKYLATSDFSSYECEQGSTFSSKSSRFQNSGDFAYKPPIIYRNPFQESSPDDKMTVTESQVYLSKLKRDMAISPLKASIVETKTLKDVQPCIESCRTCKRRETRAKSMLVKAPVEEAPRKKMFGWF